MWFSAAFVANFCCVKTRNEATVVALLQARKLEDPVASLHLLLPLRADLQRTKYILTESCVSVQSHVP